MIFRGIGRKASAEEVESKGFDAFDLRLGDLMRGERATMGKSLLDVQRELKIKANYIAAIENCDPAAFHTQGFIAGYVRSYARFLGMDPDWAFETFCRESGFQPRAGMVGAGAQTKTQLAERKHGASGPNIFAQSRTPYLPTTEGILARLEPTALGSMLVLGALIVGLGYGGWAVLKEVQKVQLAPVENVPVVVADLDPLAGIGAAVTDETRLAMTSDTATGYSPAGDGLDRAYRPQALDLPVMIARDGPIAAVDPDSTGALAPVAVAEAAADAVLAALNEAVSDVPASAVQVTEGLPPAVSVVAVRPAWVRVQAADGSVIYEGIMNAGASWDVPQTEEPAVLRVGESGSVYFLVNGTHYGPVGERGVVTSNVALSSESLTATYAVADLDGDRDLARMVAENTVTE